MSALLSKEEREEISDFANSSIYDRSKAIFRLLADIAERERRESEQTAIINENDEKIEQLHRQLRERDAEIKRLRKAGTISNE